ncbi:MAG: hypothetical protein BIFFINMI_03042 [Phycisphaerae bacterium]|nr:hypothetical protein [Phycisphaerae bacterium]
MAIRTYRDLEVWQRAMDLLVEVYRISVGFPDLERFGLTMQVRRAAGSVANNIAEGHGRLSRKDYLRFLSISRGSLCETETELPAAVRLGFVKEADIRKAWDLTQETGRLLNGLIRSLASKRAS